MKRRKRKLTAILNQIGRERGLRGWLSVDFLKASDVALGHSRRFLHVRNMSGYEVISEIPIVLFCRLKADFEWAAIRSFLLNKPRGIPRVDDRRVLNGGG